MSKNINKSYYTFNCDFLFFKITVFKTSLPRSAAYWGITKKPDIMDKQ